MQNKNKAKKAIVIGSGIGGLAVAIRLRNLGFEVTVYETNSYPGGKISEIHLEGYRFDCGPSLFTMPHFVEELFEISQKKTSDYFNYHKKDRICNYFYEDGTRFIAPSNPGKFATAASTIFDVAPEEILTYFENCKRKYELTSSLFLEKSLHKLATYLSTGSLQAIFQISVLDIDTTLHKLNNRHFKDQRLVQFFDRFATYNGSSPYQTPGIMSMIPHLEHRYGTFFPKGGMYNITKSLYQLALDLGISFHFHTKVERIIVSDKKAIGICLPQEIVGADVVVSNMDIVPSYRKLLPDQKSPEKILEQPRSSSALIFYWGIKGTFPELDLHNIFFSQKYQKEFHYIFDKKEVSNDPTVYINISSKEAPEDAPSDCENWFVMINIPCNEGQDWEQIIQKSRVNILQKLSRILNRDIASLIATETILDPRSIESKTQSYQGSLYGASSNNKYAAFLRHPNFSRKIKNLYFCGGSVHPGGGIPLCLLSAKIVADLVQKDFANTCKK